METWLMKDQECSADAYSVFLKELQAKFPRYIQLGSDDDNFFVLPGEPPLALCYRRGGRVFLRRRECGGITANDIVVAGLVLAQYAVPEAACAE